MADKLFIAFAGNEALRSSNGLNSALVVAADAAAALALMKANKLDGETSNRVLDAWTFTEIASDNGNLSTNPLWIEGVPTGASFFPRRGH